ncbi:hypothetical protein CHINAEXTREME_07535 [Halobiforma lacisalsi AJ5]|uniref:DUF8060 domain-containing protein n=1 Tax=Natronobacterium lacisalsi AJ5 TaxID=358396 RepID=M0LU62_NATLA|nr:hypothetical protein [Halobiforma lacisalsi]APW97632.1 hypothetical protein CHINAEXTREME_07535 [Halobiforma lacisalsi AJ5]EMA36981.1 hypothetical protein C445_02026 [Halobiforma lacisalsi AJ5]
MTDTPSTTPTDQTASTDATDGESETSEVFDGLEGGSETESEGRGNGELPPNPPERPPVDDRRGRIDLEAATIRRYLAWGALAVCSVLAVVATVRLYGSVTAAIDLWVTERYQPLMRAAFNVVVLLGSLTGISLVLRELN